MNRNGGTRGRGWGVGGGGSLVVLFILSSLLFPPTLPASSSSDPLLTAAREAWAERDQEGRTLAAIALYQQALKADAGQKAAWIELTQAMNRAVRHVDTSKEKKEWAKRALDAAHQAVLENPNNAMAYALEAEAIGQWAQVNKGIGSLKRVKESVKLLHKALELDARNAYAHMLLSSFYRAAPSVISIGDKRKALEHAQKAVEYDPKHAIHHLTLAKVLLDYGRREEAMASLKTILTLEPPADAVPETRADQETAKRMLAKLDAK